MMAIRTQDFVGQIRGCLFGLSNLYSRLVLVVGPADSGKTATLGTLAAEENSKVINIGLELSRRLLDLTERQRILQLPVLLQEIVQEGSPEPTILDNTEILFSPVLKQDPLRLLQSLSRNRTLVASWLGTVTGSELTYAAPGHPEFRRYSTDGLLLVNLGIVAVDSRSQEKAEE